MNPKLVEEVARAIYASHNFVKSWDDPDLPKGWHKSCRRAAQAAIRVCMARAAEIARDGSRGYGGTTGLGTATRVSERIEDAIKREGGLT